MTFLKICGWPYKNASTPTSNIMPLLNRQIPTTTATRSRCHPTATRITQPINVVRERYTIPCTLLGSGLFRFSVTWLCLSKSRMKYTLPCFCEWCMNATMTALTLLIYRTACIVKPIGRHARKESYFLPIVYRCLKSFIVYVRVQCMYYIDDQ